MAETGLFGHARNAIRRVMENSTLRGVTLIGGGAAAGQAIVLVATPIVSRLYGPHAYGALAVFGGILSIASILVTFRFEVAIPLPEDDHEARDVLALCLTLALLSGGLMGLGLLVWSFFAKSVPVAPLFRHLVWTLPLGMFSIGCYQSLAYWATRKRLYRSISATRLSQSIASVGAQIILYRIPPGGLGLILGYILGQASGVRTLFSAFWRSSPRTPLPTLAALVAVGRKYGNVSAFGTASALAATLGDALPSLLLAKAFGLEVAGVYLMASRVFAIPAQMVGASVSQVFMGETSQRLREDTRSVFNYFHSVHRNLRWVGAGVLVLGALSPLFLPWVLGAKWQAAGVVAAILAPMAAADITVRPLYNITVIANRPKLQLVSGLLPLGMSILGLGLPILLGFSEKAALISYSLCRCMGCWMIYIIYRDIVKSLDSCAQAPSGSDTTLQPLETMEISEK